MTASKTSRSARLNESETAFRESKLTGFIRALRGLYSSFLQILTPHRTQEDELCIKVEKDSGLLFSTVYLGLPFLLI